MPDDRKKPTAAEKTGDAADDGFRVDVPDDLLDEAVSAVDKRVAEGKAQVNTPDDVELTGDFPAEISVDVDSSATEAEGPDIEKMSIDDLLNSGFLPDKVVAAFYDERNKSAEMRKAADFTKNKLDAFLAESEAFRKRLTREKDDAIKFAAEKVLKEFLPVVDNLERALAHSGEAAAAGSIREGVEITLRQANHVLEKQGVTRVEAAIGSPFDPRFHEAVSQQENKDIPANSVAAVMQAGFLLHDRLLRPAMVAVAKGGSATKAAAPSTQSGASAPAAAPTAAAAAPATTTTPAAETPEQRLERIRKAGTAAREARMRKREEEEAKASAKPAAAAPAETPDEKLERIRKTGQAAREARLARKREAAREREQEEAARKQQAAAAEESAAKETPEQKLERIRKAGQAAREAREAKRRERERGDAQSVAAAEKKAESTSVAGETPEQKLERIRKTGEAAREARRKKREAEEAKDRTAASTLEEDEAAAEAEAQEAAATPAKTETPEEKLARIRKTGQAAREARKKRREQGATAAPANPLASPAFEDDDLDNWESTVDSIRTDKS